MIKRICVLIICMMLLPLINADAMELNGIGRQNLFKEVKFDDAAPLSFTADNGLQITFKTPIVRNILYAKPTDSHAYYFELLSRTNVIGVEGVVVYMTNTTDRRLTIKWSRSRFDIGQYNGMPFLPGMRYMDAGKPEFLRDTVIEPHQTYRETVLIAMPWYDARAGWQNGFVELKDNDKFDVSLHLEVEDADGNTSSVSASSPDIILPEQALDAVLHRKPIKNMEDIEWKKIFQDRKSTAYIDPNNAVYDPISNTLYIWIKYMKTGTDLGFYGLCRIENFTITLYNGEDVPYSGDGNISFELPELLNRLKPVAGPFIPRAKGSVDIALMEVAVDFMIK